MATDIKYRQIGAGVFSIGPWVTAGGAGTLVDLGHMAEVSLADSGEMVPFESERAQGALAGHWSKAGYSIKVKIKEFRAELLRQLLQQPAANKTGTGDNLTLLVGEKTVEYFQASLVLSSQPHGSTGAHTWTFWRLAPQTLGELVFTKNAFGEWEATLMGFQDESVATADKFYKRVVA